MLAHTANHVKETRLGLEPLTHEPGMLVLAVGGEDVLPHGLSQNIECSHNMAANFPRLESSRAGNNGFVT